MSDTIATNSYFIVSPGARSAVIFISSVVELPTISVPGLVPFDEFVGDNTFRVQLEKALSILPSSCSAVIKFMSSIIEILFANFSVSLLVTSIL